MNRGLAGAVTLAAVTIFAGCGSTYVDTSVTTVPDPAAPTTTLPPVDLDAPLDELLTEINELMSDLDEQIINGNPDAIERIDDLWYVAEIQIREIEPDDVFNFEQAIDLARSGVERNRPSDATKAYKIFTDVASDYLDI